MSINCDFMVRSFYSEDFYTCKVSEANITEKDHVIKEFEGVHLKGKSHEDVKRIFFYKTTVNHFPRDLEKHFPNLTHLQISECDLNEITRNDLKGLERLVGLSIENCELISLPDDLFTAMPNLREVSFDHNKIEFASSELLKPLIGRGNLTVSLRGNKRINACYSPGKYTILGFFSLFFGDVYPKSLEQLMKIIDEKCIKPTPPTPDLIDTISSSADLEESRSFCAEEIDPSEAIEDLVKQLLSLKELLLLNDEKCLKSLPSSVPDDVDFNKIIKNLWFSGKFSDLTIYGDERQFKVHKPILGMKSEVFAQFFEQQTKANVIKISDFSSEHVESLLKFIYTNEISRVGNAKENFKIANKFKVQAMERIYEKIIYKQVDDSNALETFLFAHRFSSQLLKKKAFKQIAEKIPELSEELMEDPEELKKFLNLHYNK